MNAQGHLNGDYTLQEVMHYVWWKTSDRVECSNFSVKTQGRFTPYSFTKLGSSKTRDSVWFCVKMLLTGPLSAECYVM